MAIWTTPWVCALLSPAARAKATRGSSDAPPVCAVGAEQSTHPRYL